MSYEYALEKICDDHVKFLNYDTWNIILLLIMYMQFVIKSLFLISRILWYYELEHCYVILRVKSTQNLRISNLNYMPVLYKENLCNNTIKMDKYISISLIVVINLWHKLKMWCSVYLSVSILHQHSWYFQTDRRYLS